MAEGGRRFACRHSFPLAREDDGTPAASSGRIESWRPCMSSAALYSRLPEVADHAREVAFVRALGGGSYPYYTPAIRYLSASQAC